MLNSAFSVVARRSASQLTRPIISSQFHTARILQRNNMVPSVAIVGGGPCGLTLARLLEVKGVDYVVYERDESSSISDRGGGSLDIHPKTGQLALREAKLHDAFLKHARYEDDKFDLFDPQGKRWGEVGGEKAEGDVIPTEEERPEIDRLALRQILLDSIPKEKIQWGHGLKRAAFGDDGRPVLEFTNGSMESGFDLVVGADGAWSKVRPLITEAKPKYSGKLYIETRIRHGNPIHDYMASKFGPGSSSVFNGPKSLVIQRQGDHAYRIYYGIAVPEDFTQTTADLSNAESTRALLLSEEFFGGYAEEFKDLIRHSDNFRGWPLYGLPVEAMGWKSVPGVTLVGDAAHVTIPSGEGVNVAMNDALVLANKLEQHGTAQGRDQVVREYEEDMFLRGKETIEESWKLWELLSHPGGPKAILDIFLQSGAGKE
ncbi:unnamed protein product [Clonostachys byssicola]|uniref:FAD-binding domain-containing protein n=1 Tax=Clonostachys byssicola TaxID=160290 RepID=A0A9N9UFU9_9HYPO|nr:unnamed protein product [Clonostachys byssicola]